MKIFSSVKTCAAIAAGAVSFYSAFADVSTSSYIQDGLVGQWDAIHNEGADLPHNPDAKVWTNLVSDSMHAVAATGENTPAWKNGNAMATKNDSATGGKGYFYFTPTPDMYFALTAGSLLSKRL